VKKHGNADQRFVWGWLRLVLGIAQMTLAITTFGMFLIVGFHPITWILFAVTTTLLIVSRILYRGRKGPNGIGK